MNRNSVSLSDRLINWIVRYNLPIIFLWAFLLCFFEIIEPLIKNEPLTDPFHVLEVLFFLALLLLVRLLIDHLIRANVAQNRALEILKFKHNVSLELTKQENWDGLKNELVRLPARVVDVSATRLQVYNPVSDKLEEDAIWYAKSPLAQDFNQDCQQCIAKRSTAGLSTGVCVYWSDASGEQKDSPEYCIPIVYGSSLLALIQIIPKDGVAFSSEQIETLESVVPEISLALMASQEQEALKEMQNTRTALAERRTVSTFIHDQLGQNLGFLHLKLDQLVENKIVQKDKVVQTDLMRLREVANESYEIVRDILKTIRSETTPNITNLLQEQARSVSRRVGFELNFQTTGKPAPLLPVIQQSVFFTFCEILNNIEKHARANKVDVLVVWNNGVLDVSVADDGKGFEPERVQGDNHFGLQIIKERVAGIKGKIMINSSHNSGTVVSISVPFQSIEKVLE